MSLVVDTSALVAVLLGEPERHDFHRVLLINRAPMSVASVTELMLVMQGRLGAASIARADRAIDRYGIEVQPVEADDLSLIRGAILDYGRGRRAPPAVLNFGDLFAYALSRRLGLPLLYKGQDFARTDVQAFAWS